MQRSSRTRRLTVAAAVSAVVAAVSVAAYDLPTLAKGSGDGSGQFALVLGSFASDVLALVGAYGTFRRQRWGIVVLVVVNCYWVLQAVAAVMDGSAALGVVMIAVTLTTLWLLLARDGVVRRDG